MCIRGANSGKQIKNQSPNNSTLSLLNNKTSAQISILKFTGHTFFAKTKLNSRSANQMMEITCMQKVPGYVINDFVRIIDERGPHSELSKSIL